MKAGQLKAGLVAPKIDGYDDLSTADQAVICVCELLYDAAEKCGGFKGWTLAWLMLCNAMGRDPMREPWKILEYADIDRHCGYKHGPKELEMERQAYIRNRREGPKRQAAHDEFAAELDRRRCVRKDL